MHGPRRLAWTLLLAAGLSAACSSGSSRRGSPVSDSGGSSVVIPNAPAGDAGTRGVRDLTTAQAAPELTPAQAQATMSKRQREADAIWKRAVALECRDPEEAADLFEDVVDDYPEYERAAEARFREGRAWYRAKEYSDAAGALEEYMRLAPVNPHLAEVERILYESGRRYIRRSKGPFGIFGTDTDGLNALKFVAQTFPTGEYPDDALLELGNYYRKEEDYTAAALHFKELLLRYPDSEWSFKARLCLAESYRQRDQGPPYNAGFVVLDPREPVPEAALIMGGPVESALELALAQYDSYLERMEADPARMAEYCRDVEWARKRRLDVIECLAAKDLHRGDWYAGDGCQAAALSYWRLAAARTGTKAAAAANQRLRTAGPCSTPVAPTTVPQAAPTSPSR